MKTVAHYKAGPFVPLTENWMSNMISRMGAYRQVVYCHRRQNLRLYAGLKVRSLGLKGRVRPWAFINNRLCDTLGYYPGLRLFLLLDRPALLHAHFGPSGTRMMRLAEAEGIPLVTSFYGYDVGMLPSKWPECRELYRRLFERGRLFLAEGPFMAERLKELGCPEDKLTVHRLGVDLEAVRWEPRLPGEDGEVRLLIAASFREKKGIPLAIRAFALAQRRRPSLKMRLSVVGDSPGFPETEQEKRRILEEVESSGCGDRVEMLGYCDRRGFLEQLYRNHIFLSPSITARDGDSEGGAPVAIIEASASGMPVLSTFHCDIPQVVLHGTSGLLSREGDVEELAANLEELALNPHRWEEMGRRGRSHVEERFDLDRQARGLEALYDEVLSEAGAG